METGWSNATAHAIHEFRRITSTWVIGHLGKTQRSFQEKYRNIIMGTICEYKTYTWTTADWTLKKKSFSWVKSNANYAYYR